jgi:RecQ-mediated genome instability protein 1
MPPSNAAGGDVATSIYDSLAAKHIAPTQQWLQNLMPSVNVNVPLAATLKTALFRLLNTDITTTLQSSPQNCFPAGITNTASKEQKLRGPVPVQVLDIEDIGRSSWSQVDAIEMEERGELRKGSEIIRVTEDEDNTDPNARAATAAAGPHKLLLQDAKGNKAYGFELESVKGIGPALSIGSKVVLRDLVVARGVILLVPLGVEVLGGKVEVWDKKWREERKKVLKERAGWTEAAT